MLRPILLFSLVACATLAAPPAPLYAPDLASLAGAGARAETGAAPDGGDALVFDGSSESGVKLQVSDTFRRALSGEEVSASFWFRLDAPSESDIAAGFFACPRYYDSAPVQFKLATKPTDFSAAVPTPQPAWRHAPSDQMKIAHRYPFFVPSLSMNLPAKRLHRA